MNGRHKEESEGSLQREEEGSMEDVLDGSRDDITASTEDFLNSFPEPECERHPSQRLTKFCTVCKVAVCLKCIAISHGACSHISVHKGIEHQRTFMEASLSTAEEHMRSIQLRLKEIQRLETAEKQQRKEISAMLEESVQKILETMQDRHNELYDQLEVLLQRRKQRLQDLKNLLHMKHDSLHKGRQFLVDMLEKGDSKALLESQKTYDEQLQAFFLNNSDFHPSEEDVLSFLPQRMDHVMAEIRRFGLMCDTPVRPKNSTLPVGFRQACVVHEEVRIPLVLRDNENREVGLDPDSSLQEFAVTLVSPYENAYFVSLERDKLDSPEGDSSKAEEENSASENHLFLKYRLDMEGTYDISVKVLGEHIKGSPFTIKTLRPAADSEDYGVELRRPKRSAHSPSQRQRVSASRSLSNVKQAAGGGLHRSSEVPHRSVSRSGGAGGGLRRSGSRGHATSTFLSSTAPSSVLRDDLKFKMGSHGRNRGEFSNPQGLCVTNTEQPSKVCITDSGNACVQIFSRTGEFLLKFGQRGRDPGQLQRPTDIAETAHGNLVISDFDNRCVHIFTKDGRYITRFGQKYLLGPKGVAVDREGHIVVVDNKNCCVCVFLSTGKFHYKFGIRGNADHQFAAPHYVAVNSQNQYLVTDFHNHMVKVFDAKGIFIFAFGGHGSENGAFHAPTGITVDERDNIVVADWGNSRVQIFDRDGHFLNVVNSNAAPLYGPQGVMMLPPEPSAASSSLILVIDAGNHCCKAYDFPLI